MTELAKDDMVNVSKSKSLNVQSTSRIGTVLVGMGLLFIFAALCTLPAALEKNAESSLVGIAATFFSFGALLVASGIYAKAYALKAQTDGTVAEQAASPRRGGCELCGNEAPVVKCKVHQLSLCGNCLARHYDYRSCTYVPVSAGSPSKAPRAMAKSRGL